MIPCGPERITRTVFLSLLLLFLLHNSAQQPPTVATWNYAAGTIDFSGGGFTIGFNYFCNFLIPTSCAHLKQLYPTLQSGYYYIDPDGTGGLPPIRTYCDMTTGFQMCYTSDGSTNVRLSTETERGEFGKDGYRGDCRNVKFGEIMYINHNTVETAVFGQTSVVVTPSANYNAIGSTFGTWSCLSGSCDAKFSYQLTICDMWMYTAFMISGITRKTTDMTQNCWKHCSDYCGDGSTPYFRTNGENPGGTEFTGVAFNENGHGAKANKLMSVGVRPAGGVVPSGVTYISSTTPQLVKLGGSIQCAAPPNNGLFYGVQLVNNGNTYTYSVLSFTCNGVVSTDTTVCSGRGTCVSYNTCVCSSGYGKYCQFIAATSFVKQWQLTGTISASSSTFADLGGPKMEHTITTVPGEPDIVIHAVIVGTSRSLNTNTEYRLLLDGNEIARTNAPGRPYPLQETISFHGAATGIAPISHTIRVEFKSAGTETWLATTLNLYERILAAQTYPTGRIAFNRWANVPRWDFTRPVLTADQQAYYTIAGSTSYKMELSVTIPASRLRIISEISRVQAMPSGNLPAELAVLAGSLLVCRNGVGTFNDWFYARGSMNCRIDLTAGTYLISGSIRGSSGSTMFLTDGNGLQERRLITIFESGVQTDTNRLIIHQDFPYETIATPTVTTTGAWLDWNTPVVIAFATDVVYDLEIMFESEYISTPATPSIVHFRVTLDNVVMAAYSTPENAIQSPYGISLTLPAYAVNVQPGNHEVRVKFLVEKGGFESQQAVYARRMTITKHKPSATYFCFGIAYNDPNVCSGVGKCTTTDVCSCPAGVSGQRCNIAVRGNFEYIIGAPVMWHEAWAACRDTFKSSLATISGQTEMNDVHAFLKQLGVYKYIIGYTKPFTPEFTFVSPTTLQSSTYLDMTSLDHSMAIDKSIYTFSHTAANMVGEWWQVDIGVFASIYMIEIIQRRDCCLDRINPAVVSVFNGDTATWSQAIASSDYRIRLYPNGARGKVIKVQLASPAPQFLHIAEVRISTFDRSVAFGWADGAPVAYTNRAESSATSYSHCTSVVDSTTWEACLPSPLFYLCKSSKVCYGLSANMLGTCSGNGTCIGLNQCNCNYGYAGSQCELFACYGLASNLQAVCSGNGQCTGIDNCKCKSGYSGERCQYPSCFGIVSTASNACSSPTKGTCIDLDKCNCTAGYAGKACELNNCFGKLSNESTVCSGKGTCVSPNTCQCGSWCMIGSQCEVDICQQQPLILFGQTVANSRTIGFINTPINITIEINNATTYIPPHLVGLFKCAIASNTSATFPTYSASSNGRVFICTVQSKVVQRVYITLIALNVTIATNPVVIDFLESGVISQYSGKAAIYANETMNTTIAFMKPLPEVGSGSNLRCIFTEVQPTAGVTQVLSPSNTVVYPGSHALAVCQLAATSTTKVFNITLAYFSPTNMTTISSNVLKVATIDIKSINYYWSSDASDPQDMQGFTNLVTSDNLKQGFSLAFYVVYPASLLPLFESWKCRVASSVIGDRNAQLSDSVQSLTVNSLTGSNSLLKCSWQVSLEGLLFKTLLSRGQSMVLPLQTVIDQNGDAMVSSVNELPIIWIQKVNITLLSPFAALVDQIPSVNITFTPDNALSLDFANNDVIWLCDFTGDKNFTNALIINSSTLQCTPNKGLIIPQTSNVTLWATSIRNRKIAVPVAQNSLLFYYWTSTSLTIEDVVPFVLVAKEGRVSRDLSVKLSSQHAIQTIEGLNCFIFNSKNASKVLSYGQAVLLNKTSDSKTAWVQCSLNTEIELSAEGFRLEFRVVPYKVFSTPALDVSFKVSNNSIELLGMKPVVLSTISNGSPLSLLVRELAEGSLVYLNIYSDVGYSPAFSLEMFMDPSYLPASNPARKMNCTFIQPSICTFSSGDLKFSNTPYRVSLRLTATSNHPASSGQMTATLPEVSFVDIAENVTLLAAIPFILDEAQLDQSNVHVIRLLTDKSLNPMFSFECKLVTSRGDMTVVNASVNAGAEITCNGVTASFLSGNQFVKVDLQVKIGTIVYALSSNSQTIQIKRLMWSPSALNQQDEYHSISLLAHEGLWTSWNSSSALQNLVALNYRLVVSILTPALDYQINCSVSENLSCGRHGNGSAIDILMEGYYMYAVNASLILLSPSGNQIKVTTISQPVVLYKQSTISALSPNALLKYDKSNFRVIFSDPALNWHPWMMTSTSLIGFKATYVNDVSYLSTTSNGTLIGQCSMASSKIAICSQNGLLDYDAHYGMILDLFVGLPSIDSNIEIRLTMESNISIPATRIDFLTQGKLEFVNSTQNLFYFVGEILEAKLHLSTWLSSTLLRNNIAARLLVGDSWKTLSSSHFHSVSEFEHAYVINDSSMKPSGLAKLSLWCADESGPIFMISNSSLELVFVEPQFYDRITPPIGLINQTTLVTSYTYFKTRTDYGADVNYTCLFAGTNETVSSPAVVDSSEEGAFSCDVFALTMQTMEVSIFMTVKNRTRLITLETLSFTLVDSFFLDPSYGSVNGNEYSLLKKYSGSLTNITIAGFNWLMFDCLRIPALEALNCTSPNVAGVISPFTSHYLIGDNRQLAIQYVFVNTSHLVSLAPTVVSAVDNKQTLLFKVGSPITTVEGRVSISINGSRVKLDEEFWNATTIGSVTLNPRKEYVEGRYDMQLYYENSNLVQVTRTRIPISNMLSYYVVSPRVISFEVVRNNSNLGYVNQPFNTTIVVHNGLVIPALVVNDIYCSLSGNLIPFKPTITARDDVLLVTCLIEKSAAVVEDLHLEFFKVYSEFNVTQRFLISQNSLKIIVIGRPLIAKVNPYIAHFSPSQQQSPVLSINVTGYEMTSSFLQELHLYCGFVSQGSSVLFSATYMVGDKLLCLLDPTISAQHRDILTSHHVDAIVVYVRSASFAALNESYAFSDNAIPFKTSDIAEVVVMSPLSSAIQRQNVTLQLGNTVLDEETLHCKYSLKIAQEQASNSVYQYSKALVQSATRVSCLIENLDNRTFTTSVVYVELSVIDTLTSTELFVFTKKGVDFIFVNEQLHFKNIPLSYINQTYQNYGFMLNYDIPIHLTQSSYNHTVRMKWKEHDRNLSAKLECTNIDMQLFANLRCLFLLSSTITPLNLTFELDITQLTFGSTETYPILGFVYYEEQVIDSVVPFLLSSTAISESPQQLQIRLGSPIQLNYEFELYCQFTFSLGAITYSVARELTSREFGCDISSTIQQSQVASIVLVLEKKVALSLNLARVFVQEPKAVEYQKLTLPSSVLPTPSPFAAALGQFYNSTNNGSMMGIVSTANRGPVTGGTIISLELLDFPTTTDSSYLMELAVIEKHKLTKTRNCLTSLKSMTSESTRRVAVTCETSSLVMPAFGSIVPVRVALLINNTVSIVAAKPFYYHLQPAIARVLPSAYMEKAKLSTNQTITLQGTFPVFHRSLATLPNEILIAYFVQRKLANETMDQVEICRSSCRFSALELTEQGSSSFRHYLDCGFPSTQLPAWFEEGNITIGLSFNQWNNIDFYPNIIQVFDSSLILFTRSEGNRAIAGKRGQYLDIHGSHFPQNAHRSGCDDTQETAAINLKLEDEFFLFKYAATLLCDQFIRFPVPLIYLEDVSYPRVLSISISFDNGQTYSSVSEVLDNHLIIEALPFASFRDGQKLFIQSGGFMQQQIDIVNFPLVDLPFPSTIESFTLGLQFESVKIPLTSCRNTSWSTFGSGIAFVNLTCNVEAINDASKLNVSKTAFRLTVEALIDGSFKNIPIIQASNTVELLTLPTIRSVAPMQAVLGKAVRFTVRGSGFVTSIKSILMVRYESSQRRNSEQIAASTSCVDIQLLDESTIAFSCNPNDEKWASSNPFSMTVDFLLSFDGVSRFSLRELSLSGLDPISVVPWFQVSEFENQDVENQGAIFTFQENVFKVTVTALLLTTEMTETVLHNVISKQGFYIRVKPSHDENSLLDTVLHSSQLKLQYNSSASFYITIPTSTEIPLLSYPLDILLGISFYSNPDTSNLYFWQSMMMLNQFREPQILSLDYTSIPIIDEEQPVLVRGRYFGDITSCMFTFSDMKFKRWYEIDIRPKSEEDDPHRIKVPKGHAPWYNVTIPASVESTTANLAIKLVVCRLPKLDTGLLGPFTSVLISLANSAGLTSSYKELPVYPVPNLMKFMPSTLPTYIGNNSFYLLLDNYAADKFQLYVKYGFVDAASPCLASNLTAYIASRNNQAMIDSMLSWVLQKYQTSLAEAWKLMNLTVLRCQPPAHEEGTVVISLSYNKRTWHNFTTELLEFTPCEAGLSQPSVEVICKPCAPGYYKPSKGSYSCLRCPNGTYCDQEGSILYKSCPLHMTSHEGSTHFHDCACTTRYMVNPYFVENYNSDNERCIECPVGGICNELNTTVPLATFGYWISSYTPTVLYSCIPKQACPGGQPLTCAIGYEGLACGRCMGDFYKWQGACLPCSADTWWRFILAVALIALIAGLFFSFSSIKVSHISSISIGITFWQVVSMFNKFPNVKWSSGVETTFVASSVTNFNFDFLAVSCLIRGLKFEVKLILTMLIPVFILVIFIAFFILFTIRNCIAGKILSRCFKMKFLPYIETFDAEVYLKRKKPSRTSWLTSLKSFVLNKLIFIRNVLVWFIQSPVTAEQAAVFRNKLINGYCTFVAFAYGFMMLTASEIFICTTQPDGNQTLNASPDILCYKSQQWWLLFPFAITIYVLLIGITIIFYAYLFLNQSKLRKVQGKSNPFRQRFKFVLQRFKTKFFFWEGIISLRKILLSLLFIFLKPMLVLVVSIAVIFVGLLLHMRYVPFKKKFHNFIEYVILINTLLILVCGLLFFVDQTKSIPYFEQVVGVFALALMIFSSALIIICIVWDILTRRKKERRKAVFKERLFKSELEKRIQNQLPFYDLLVLFKKTKNYFVEDQIVDLTALPSSASAIAFSPTSSTRNLLGRVEELSYASQTEYQRTRRIDFRVDLLQDDIESSEEETFSTLNELFGSLFNVRRVKRKITEFKASANKVKRTLSKKHSRIITN